MHIYELDAETESQIADAIASVSASAAAWYGQPLARSKGDLDLIQRMLDDGRVRAGDRAGLIELGIVFGDLVARSMGWRWIVVEDDGAIEAALLAGGSAASGEAGILLVTTMILGRVEDGARVNMRDLYAGVVAQVGPMARDIGRSKLG